MKLRKEVKVILIWIVLIVLNISLKHYNTHLQADTELKRLEIENYSVVNKTSLKSNEIEPCSTSSVKSYMDYKTITSTTSDQYKFIQEHMEVRNGFLFDKEGYIGVALGSWFGDIGSRWVFELSSGELLYTVKVEHKDDKHTINGCEHINDRSVIEFVIDTETNMFEIGSNGLILNGNFNNHELFNGTIEKVRKEN